MEQSYLLAAGERGRGEGLGLCTLAAEILECQAIVVRLKIKIPNKKTSKGLRRRREEIFQSLKILVFIFNYYDPLPPPKKIVTKGENLFIRRTGSLCQEEKRRTAQNLAHDLLLFLRCRLLAGVNKALSQT